MISKNAVITIEAAVQLLSALTDLVKEARESGKGSIDLSPISSSFLLLDRAEHELDEAIKSAE